MNPLAYIQIRPVNPITKSQIVTPNLSLTCAPRTSLDKQNNPLDTKAPAKNFISRSSYRRDSPPRAGPMNSKIMRNISRRRKACSRVINQQTRTHTQRETWGRQPPDRGGRRGRPGIFHTSREKGRLFFLGANCSSPFRRPEVMH